jgi:hypothetical protein
MADADVDADSDVDADADGDVDVDADVECRNRVSGLSPADAECDEWSARIPALVLQPRL